jgi:Uma2 family endonuclease
LELADNATVRLDLDNEPQPDALLRIKTELGGQSRISEDDYIEGSPELIVEISGSTVSYDLYNKLTIYRRHGVKEYIVWRVYDQEIDWFILEAGEYVKLPIGDLGLMESRIFPGLVLSVDDMLKGNLAKVLGILQAEINSERHRSYCHQLGG